VPRNIYLIFETWLKFIRLSLQGPTFRFRLGRRANSSGRKKIRERTSCELEKRWWMSHSVVMLTTCTVVMHTSTTARWFKPACELSLMFTPRTVTAALKPGICSSCGRVPSSDSSVFTFCTKKKQAAHRTLTLQWRHNGKNKRRH